MPTDSIRTTANRPLVTESNYDQEVRKYPRAAQKLALDLLDHITKVNVLIKLHEVCPDRVSTEQIKQARVKLQEHFQTIANCKTGVPLTVNARTSSNKCMSFLVKWEQNRVASNDQVANNELPEFQINQICRAGLQNALLMKDTAAYSNTLKQILELLKTEYQTVVSELELIPTDQDLKEAHLKLQSVLVNQLIVSRALCVLTVTSKARLEYGHPDDQHINDLFDRMYESGQKDVFLNDLSKLTQIQHSKNRDDLPISDDQDYIQSYISQILGNAKAIHHLALEISNAFYHESFAERQSVEYKQCLQDGFDAGLLLLDTIEAVSKYSKEHSDFCPKPAPQTNLEKPIPTHSTQSNQAQAEKVAELLGTTVCPTLANLVGPSGNLYLPDLVLQSLEEEAQEAIYTLKQIDELLALKVLSQPMHNALLTKKEEVIQTINQATAPELAFDLIKQYPVPQATNWQTLLENDQLLACSQIRKLPTSDGSGLFEVGIQAKPNSSGVESPKVWLHLHTDPTFRLRKKQSLVQCISDQLEKVNAAHLKNDYFRNKGKRWEQAQQMQGKLDALVQRSPVSETFIHELLTAIKNNRVPVDATI